MSIPVRAAAAAVAVAAVTLAGAGAAVAAPAGDNPVKVAGHDRNERAHRIADLRKAGVRGRIDLGTPSPSLPGAPPGLVQYRSAVYTLKPEGDSAVINVLCPTGAYVQFNGDQRNGPIGPVVGITSDSNFVGAAVFYPRAINAINEPLDEWQGFEMKLSSWSPETTHTSFYWDCFPV